jgi:putative ATP-dependent DNA ligase
MFPDFLKNYLSEKDIEDLRKKEALDLYEFENKKFIRLSQDYKKFLRGTVFYEKGTVKSYPKIMRILHLENGIKRYFKNRFYLEEKVDGYNVRIALIDDKLLAFTRGGFICPFTTDRITDLIDLEFFKRYPDYIICGEVVGPGSPYNTENIPYVKEDVLFLVFDIIDDKGNFLTTERRYNVLENFNIQQVRHWGPFYNTDMEVIKKIIFELDKEQREGIVIKPISSGRSIKYVTLSSCLRDIEATAHLISELPAGFFVQRIIRAVFFCHEFAISLDDRYLLDFSKALHLIPQGVLKNIEKGDSVKEYFKVKLRNKESIDKLISHLNRSGVKTQLMSVEKSGDYYNAKFYRIYLKGSRELRQRLMGKGFFD